MANKLTKTLACISFLFIVLQTNAQFTADSLKAGMIQDWARAKNYTMAYLNTMPADKYSMKPTDSVKSFAEQMLHLAYANVMFSKMAAGDTASLKSMRDLENTASAKTKDSVMYFVTTSYDEVSKTLSGIDANKMAEPASANGFTLPKYQWLMKAFEHQTHHRGQTTIYLRLAGVKPPKEMLF